MGGMADYTVTKAAVLAFHERMFPLLPPPSNHFSLTFSDLLLTSSPALYPEINLHYNAPNILV